MKYNSTYTVASRPSRLASVQTNLIIDILKSRFPDINFNITYHSTHGDKHTDKPLREFGGTGVFVKELEIAMSRNEADFAVHSLKDVPSEIPDNFILASFSIRENPLDVIITRNGANFRSLPPDAVIGTSSPRREIQLKQIIPNTHFKDIRGNIDTRLKKLDAGEYDAIVLALAGVRRLGLSIIPDNVLSEDIMIPAVGQGILAIECRKDDIQTIELLRTINNYDSETSAIAERAFLRTMGGGCKYPMGALATIKGSTIHFIGMAGYPDKNIILKKSGIGLSKDAELIGKEIAENLIKDALNSGLNV